MILFLFIFNFLIYFNLFSLFNYYYYCYSEIKMNLNLQSKITLNNSPYIFDIDIDSSFNNLLLSDSSQSLTICDLTLFNIKNQINSCHNDTITSIEFSKSNINEFHSSSLDKTIRFWDLRDTNNIRFMIKTTEEIQTTSLGLNGNLLAIGVGNNIQFYDIRNHGRLLGVYSDCHTDIVTKLKFHPESPSILVSGGEDGLLCSFNTAVPPQSDAVISIMNTECSVRDFGFFGSTSGFEGIHTISTIENLSFWHYPSAQRIGYYPNLRSGINSDYLVNCWYESPTTFSHTPSNETDKVYLLSGLFNGEGLISEITPSFIDPKGSLSCESSETEASSNNLGGHNDIIRCVYPFGFKSMSPSTGLITGGEDGKLCLWKYNRPNIPPSPPSSSLSSSSHHNNRNRQINHGNSGHNSRRSGASNDGNFSKQMRYSPY